jgi:hypothetical protein
MRTSFADILAPKITKLYFGIENVWHQNICAKCARKMLMKLTTGGVKTSREYTQIKIVEKNWGVPVRTSMYAYRFYVTCGTDTIFLK